MELGFYSPEISGKDTTEVFAKARAYGFSEVQYNFLTSHGEEMPGEFFSGELKEVADSKAGYNPELSYGSHFFQDLVEAGILYNAIFENEKTIVYNPGLLSGYENILCDFDTGLGELRDVIQVFEVSGLNFRLCNDMKKGQILCFISAAEGAKI